MRSKIPLDIIEEGRIVINTSIFSPHISRPSPIRLYVDTGSPFTILSQEESKRLGIDVTNLKIYPKPLGGLGEGRTRGYILDNVCLVIRTGGDKLSRILMDSVLIAEEAKRTDVRKRKFKMKTPNILGADFFYESGLSLFVNYKKGNAYIVDKQEI